MARTVVAIFDVYANAEKAAYEVRDRGLRTDNISIIARDNGNKAYYRPDDKSGLLYIAGYTSHPLKVSKRQRISDGIITGGIFGGVIGIVAGAVSMFVPRLGLIAAGGPVSGLLAGFLLGGIIGGLMDIRIPRTRMKEYEELITRGNIIVSMKVDEERMDAIIDVIKENGALLVEKY